MDAHAIYSQLRRSGLDSVFALQVRVISLLSGRASQMLHSACYDPVACNTESVLQATPPVFLLLCRMLQGCLRRPRYLLERSFTVDGRHHHHPQCGNYRVPDAQRRPEWRGSRGDYCRRRHTYYRKRQQCPVSKRYRLVRTRLAVLIL